MKRRLVVNRPAYTRNPVLCTGGSSSHLPTPLPAASARVRTPLHTTTTNVVSVVCNAASARTRGMKHDDSRARTREGGSADEVYRTLDHLSKAEKKKLIDRLLLDQHLSAAPTSADRDLDMWASAVHNALVRVVGGGGAGVAGPTLVRKLVGVGNAWRPVEAFMQSSKLCELPVVERQRSYNMLANLLMNHVRHVARASGAPLSAKLVGACAVNLPGVFEGAFPGYLEAGLAKIVARQQIQL